jgi:DivIVA domain-containing protein
MPIDRDDVLRSDFPIARKGYDPAAVDAHLRRVAKGVDELAKAPPPKDTAGAAAGGKVQAIVEAAERSAEEIERQAREDADATRASASTDAREHVERVSASAAAMRDRIDALESALAELTGRFRTDAEGIATDLETLRGDVGKVRSEEAATAEVSAPSAPVAQAPVVEPELEPEPPPLPGDAEVEALEAEMSEADDLVEELETTVSAADEQPAREDPLAVLRAAIEKEKEKPNGQVTEVRAAVAEPEPEPEPVEAEVVEDEPETPDAPDEDIEGARITALGLALKGESAEQITPQLARFNLKNPAALVDEVLAKL